MTAPPGLSVVIPTWNGRALLEEFLPTVLRAAAAFQAAAGQPTETIVADDASADDTVAWLRSRFSNVRIVSGANHQGFGPTANSGMRAARYGLVYLVNNDVALRPDTLPPLASHFSDPTVFAVSGQVYDHSTGVLTGAGQLGDWRRGFLGVHRRYFVAEPAAGKPWLTLFASGGSALYHREKFLALGGFDDLFAPFGWEDVELSLRAWLSGLEIHYEPRSAVWHRFSSTIGSGYRQRRLYERNRLLAHWIHLEGGQLPVSAAFLLGKLLLSAVAVRWGNWAATGDALRFGSAVRERRRLLRAQRQRRLSDVLRLVEAQLRRPGAQLLTPESAPICLWREGGGEA